MATYNQPDNDLDPLEDDLNGMPNGGNITGNNQFGGQNLPPDHDDAPQGDTPFQDRAYDESGTRGGLGTSGGREDLSDRQVNPDTNAFRGGYGGGDYRQPHPDEVQKIGMNSRNPTASPDPTQTDEDAEQSQA